MAQDFRAGGGRQRRLRRLAEALKHGIIEGSCSSTASNARKPLVQMAPEKASGQQGSASSAGSSGKATASTNITSTVAPQRQPRRNGAGAAPGKAPLPA